MECRRGRGGAMAVRICESEDAELLIRMWAPPVTSHRARRDLWSGGAVASATCWMKMRWSHLVCG